MKYDLFRTQILCSKLIALSLTVPAGMNRQERFCPWLGSWREPEWEIRLNGPNHRCRRKDGPSKYQGDIFPSNVKPNFSIRAVVCSSFAQAVDCSRSVVCAQHSKNLFKL